MKNMIWPALVGLINMKNCHKQMVNTRRLYQLEEKICDDRSFQQISKQRTLKFLRQLTNIIWKNEKFGLDVPKIRFGPGVLYGKFTFSWCDGLNIELVESRRNILTLIHEIVHALGYDYHDRDFVEMELYLLMKYTPLNKNILYNTFNPLIDHAY